MVDENTPLRSRKNANVKQEEKPSIKEVTEEENSKALSEKEKDNNKDIPEKENKNEETSEEIDEEQIQKIAKKVLTIFIIIVVIAFLCLYFYWGYVLSKRLTYYLLSRDAWNFDFWPFEGMRRPPMPPRRPRNRGV